MIHPWKKIIEEIRNRGWTQKQFAVLVWKKNSEVNELIKGKRNITIQWDLILSEIFWTPEKYWINMQMDYDYEIAKKEREKEKIKKEQEFEVISDIEKDKIKEAPEKEEYSWKKSEIKDFGENVVSLSEEQEKSEISKWQEENISPMEEDSDSSKKVVEKTSQRDHEDDEKQHHKAMQKIFLNF